jgi:hypothetical protein
MAVRKVQEAWEKTERDEKAERVRLENRKRLDQELIEFKERNEAAVKRKAEEKEKHQAGDGMMLATPRTFRLSKGLGISMPRTRRIGRKATSLGQGVARRRQYRRQSRKLW